MAALAAPSRDLHANFVVRLSSTRVCPKSSRARETRGEALEELIVSRGRRFERWERVALEVVACERRPGRGVIQQHEVTSRSRKV